MARTATTVPARLARTADLRPPAGGSRANRTPRATTLGRPAAAAPRATAEGADIPVPRRGWARCQAIVANTLARATPRIRAPPTSTVGSNWAPRTGSKCRTGSRGANGDRATAPATASATPAATARAGPSAQASAASRLVRPKARSVRSDPAERWSHWARLWLTSTKRARAASPPNTVRATAWGRMAFCT